MDSLKSRLVAWKGKYYLISHFFLRKKFFKMLKKVSILLIGIQSFFLEVEVTVKKRALLIGIRCVSINALVGLTFNILTSSI